MKLISTSMLLAAGLMVFGQCVQPASADEMNKKTTFDTSQAIEVPGRVLLPGTYVFQLADPTQGRAVISIFRQEKNGTDQFVENTLTVPAYRARAPQHPLLTFQERGANAPEAVRSFYYPGNHVGWRFVYPSGHWQHVASAERALNR